MRIFCIRAHHLLCLLGFRGLGYGRKFVRKMAQMRRTLKTKPEALIEVLDSCDEICLSCPYETRGFCRKGKYSAGRVKEMDRRVLSTLGLKTGDVLSAGRLLRLVRKKVGSFQKLVKICGMCGWREVCMYYTDLREKWRRKISLESS